MPIGVTFFQENVVPSLEPTAYEGNEDITVRIKVWWGILDISGQPDRDPDGNVIDLLADPPVECPTGPEGPGKCEVEGTVSDSNSGACKKSPMTTFGASPPPADAECVVCDDDDAEQRSCADLLPSLTLLGDNVKSVKYSFEIETQTSGMREELYNRGKGFRVCGLGFRV